MNKWKDRMETIMKQTVARIKKIDDQIEELGIVLKFCRLCLFVFSFVHVYFFIDSFMFVLFFLFQNRRK